MKLLLLLTLVAVGHCALVGTKKCTYGPSYWCSHIHHAKECDAVQHCMDTTWKKTLDSMIGSTETCFDVVNVLNAVRKSSDSHLMDRMAQGCTGMPAHKRSVCKEHMTYDEKEVFQLLKSDLTSARIATVLGLCGNFPDTVPHPEASGDYCVDCVNFFTDIVEIFNNSESKVNSLVKQMICARIGGLKDMCDNFVDQYLPMVYSLLEQQMNPHDLCLLMQMCSNQVHADIMHNIKQAMAERQRGAETCAICKTIAQELQAALKNPSVQTDIMDALKELVCSRLPGDLATTCNTYVSEYGPVVFEILVSELDPTTVCETIGLCNSTKQDNKMVAVPLGPVLGQVHIMAPEHKDKSFPTCVLCKRLMAYLIAEIGENRTEAAVRAALMKVCSIMPKEDQDICDDFVSQYADDIVKYLMNELSPDAVCSLLKLCLTNTLPMENPKEIVKGPEMCKICEQALGYVKRALDDPNNEKKIEDLLDQACNEVPVSYKKLCTELISSATPSIINLLAQEIDPVKICTALDFCSSKDNKSQQPSQPLLFKPMMELQPARPHMLGTTKCTYGPSYWCASVENAKECKVLDHCVKKYGLKLDQNA